MAPATGPTCTTCGAPLVRGAGTCARCATPVSAPAPADRTARLPLVLLAAALALALVGIAAALTLRPGSRPTDTTGRLLPTDAGVSHATFAKLVSCRRVDGVTDVKVRIANATTIATDVAVTVGVTDPTTGASYDAVVARYAQLDQQQDLVIEAMGSRKVPAQLACQVLRVELEKGA